MSLALVGLLAFALLAAAAIAYAFTSLPTTSCTVTPTTAGATATYAVGAGRTGNGETMHRTDLTFPAGTDITGVTGASVSGNWTGGGTGNSVVRVGQTLQITWGTSCPARTTFTVTVAGVVNPAAGPYTLSGSAYSSAVPGGAAFTSAQYTITAAPTLTVAQGPDPGRPSAKVFGARSADKVVDEISLSASNGPMTLTQLVVRGLDTVGTLQTDVAGVKLYRDNGTTAGQWDAGDTQLSTTQAFSGQASGSTATFAGMSLAIPDGVTENVWIVYAAGATAVDGHVVGARVNVGDVTATGGAVMHAADIVSANAGQTVQIDAQNPTAETSDPLNDAVLTGNSKTISGTAADGTGSGVASVQVQIARSSGGYWTGTDWTGTSATWLTATGTTNWTYTWTLDAGQNNGPDTYTVTARATDGVDLSGTDATPVTGVKVDNVAPAILSAAAVDSTHVDVVFSEPLQAGSISAGDFTIAGLTVSSAVLQADEYTVRLTTSAQSNVTYTAQCSAGSVLDGAGNANGATSADFNGFVVATLTVSQGADPGRPAAAGYAARSSEKVVDELALTAAGGTMTLTEIVVSGVDSLGTLLTDVEGVRLYRDGGSTTGQWDGTDSQLGTETLFSGDATGSYATFSGLSLDIPSGTTEKVWIVYAIGSGALDGHVLGSMVNVGDVTASGGNVTQAANIISTGFGATWTIDASDPFVDTTDPVGGEVLVGAFKQIAGTASDAIAGVAAVEVRIACSDGTFWNGSTWAAGESWRPASGTTDWTYLLPLPSDENRSKTYTITARATDAVGLSSTDPSVPTVRVDTAGPAVVSASAVDATHVDVKFGEEVDAGTIASTDFAIAGLTISGATLQADDVTVRLTTSAQAPSQAYTVVCGAGNVTDTYGVPNAATQADFIGFLSNGTLTVAQGADPGRPAAQQYVGRSEERVVDELVLTASGGDVVVGSITLQGLDTADGLTTDVSSVRLFVDDGDGQYDAGDTSIGSPAVFSGDPSGSTATFGSLAHTVSAGTPQSLWVVYTIGASAADSHVLGVRVQDGDIVATGGSVSAFADIVSAASGETLRIDAEGPVANATAPATDAVLTGSSYTISGTASDSGSGLASVAVLIGSSTGSYWNGTAWAPGETWLPVVGTADWTYDWTLPSPQNRTSSYTITARATDAAGLTAEDPTPVTGVRVDNVGPDIASATAVDETTVDVVFDEPLAAASVQPGDFSVPGLAVLGAALQADTVTVRLTTSAQVPDTFYTVGVAFGNLTDAYGNLNGPINEGFHAFGTSTDTEAPSVPGGVAATPGSASPVVASVTWTASTDNTGVTGYRIWRALSLSGTFMPIGTSTSLTFDDETGLTGQSYYYKVTAYDAAGNESATSAAAGPVHASWTQAPHATYGSARLCEACHAPHKAATADKIFRDTGVAAGELNICYACHDGQGASTNVKAGAANSFALASGHKLEQAGDTGDLTDTCSGCHTPHMDYTAREMLPGKDVNGTNVTTADNAWCFACHDDADAWYAGAYPPAATPSRDATGYPVLGTFPGESTYTSSTANAHVTIPASAGFDREAGDCLYCHESHRGPNGYDGLKLTFRPSTASTVADDQANGTYAASCFYCHGGVVPPELSSAPTDIKQFVTAGGTRSGHRIKTGGGTLPVGAPLPCYDCHGPHGSERGNASLLSDTLGEGLDTSDGTNVRRVCFTCHSSSDGMVWDSVGGAYVAVGVDSVEGLRRDGTGGNVLKLPAVNGHESGSGNSCYTCHGGSYAAGGSNVHNPSGGVSQGGEPCYNCHASYKAMEDGTAPIVGDNRTDFYHHVLGGSYNNGAYQDGDYAPGPSGTYPTTGVSNIFCVTCHVDHDEFNSNNGANLREQFPSYDGTGRNTDYDSSYMLGGLCTSCHGAMQAKDTANQKSLASGTSDDGSGNTPAVNSGKYAASAHTYKVEATFGDSSTFRADCSKCHNDEQAKSFQTSQAKFGTHFSGARRLVSAFGGSVSDPLAEDHCFGCHAPAGTGDKTVAGRDAYGAAGAAMAAPAESVYSQFALAGSTHPVEADAGGTVECENCHNPHNVTTTSPVSDPDNTLNVLAYGTDAEQADFCLRCHDGDSPTYTNAPAQYVPYGVTLNGSGDDKSAYAARGHWNAAGSISAGETEPCGSCHDNHGSNAPRLLGEYDSATGTNRIRTTEIAANDNTVCSACHDAASTSFPAAEAQRDAAGYFADGTWPGTATYGVAYVPATHTGNGHLGAIWPGSSYAAGDCKNCHDVHGTANTYDGLRGTFDPTSAGDSFDTCFACHDGTAGAGKASTNIEQYYPASAGGSSADARAGHQVVTTIAGATLAQNQAVPCYDCHNPHGSGSPYALQVRDIGDAAGEISLGTADGVRKFCFACHSTADTAEGWTGSAWAGVGTTAVEGIRRDGTGGNVLKLPDVAGHRSGDAQSCYQCHGDNATNNVHNPSGGVSGGAQDCYGCHSAYQSPMEDGIGAKTGATRAGSYHHVMGSATNDGDEAFAPGSYPNSSTDVYCLSCHVDHDKFNSAKGSNLRPDITTLDPAGAATDYDSGSDTGVCTSCHAGSLTKQNPGTDQADDGSTATPKIVPGSGGGQFGASAHDYAATSSYDAATFSANCSKCHDDEQATDFQTSENKFGTHWSAARRLLSALGGTVTDPLAEQHCYRCHSEVGDLANGKTVAGRDRYDAAPMAAVAGTERVYKQFQLASKHPVVATSGNSVECESCHNAHVVTTAARVTDPANTYNTLAYGTAGEKAAYCLKCHSGNASLPAYAVNGTTYVPYDVTIAAGDAAVMNKSTNAARSHWVVNGSIGTAQPCAICHDNHGSAYPRILGAYDPATGSNRINGTAITGNNNTVCNACHTAADAAWAAPVRNGTSGYLTDGTWPGSAVYTGANGIHKTAALPAPATYAGGDCKNCHDVHGTANTYDEVRGTFTNADFSACFNCHDGNGPSTRNIAQYYPTTAGGTATQGAGTRFGHRTESAGTLPAGSALPCYDCHNPHGSGSSDGLLVVTRTSAAAQLVLGDAARPFDLGTDAGVRAFCFACHTTAGATDGNADATPYGYNGAGYAAVSAGALFEGIDRTVYDGTNKRGLKLPRVSGHYRDDTGSCYGCHGGPTSGSTTNVHNPGPGGSNGGMDCYPCHDYQSVMEDNLGSKTGATNTSAYHHVMGSATNQGDKAFAPGSYTGAGTDVYCLSCHVDHDKFNASKASNLRADMAANPAGSNSDFSSTTPYGVCVGCHAVTRTKDNANQKSTNASAQTPAIGGQPFADSKHDYPVTSSYGDGTSFNANCVKCHTDEQTYSKQSSTTKFGTHWSAEARLAKALGAALTPNANTAAEENLCYKCHSGAGSTDGYGVTPGGTPMTARSKGVQTQFAKTSKHDVGNTAWAGRHTADEYDAAPASVNGAAPGGAGWWGTANGKLHVECEDCHDVHEAQASTYAFPNDNATMRGNATAVAISGANLGAWGVDITGSASGKWSGTGTTGAPTAPTYNKVAGVAYEWQLCLKCHSAYAWGNVTPPAIPSGQLKGNAPATSPNGGGNLAGNLTDVGKDFNPKNYAFHPLFAAGLNQPANPRRYDNKGVDIGSYDTIWDGSSARRNIGGTSTGLRLTNTFVDGWRSDSLVTCSDCHNNDDTAATASHGPHGSSQRWLLRGINTGIKVTTVYGVVYPNNVGYDSSQVEQVRNFCVNCHRRDVYGDGDRGLTQTAAGTADIFSRLDHNGGMNSSCDAGDKLYNAPTGCFNCHGGRANDGAQGSGLLHGTAMGRGDGDNSGGLVQNGTLTGDAMGIRFMNGASWDAHLLMDQYSGDGSAGCSTINTTDSYSSCTQHTGVWGQSSDMNYYNP